MFAFYNGIIILYQMFYFLLFSHFCKNQFKIINKKYQEFAIMIEQNPNKFIIELRLKSLLRLTHNKYQEFQNLNKFWSKYFPLSWFALSVILSTLLLIILYGQLNFWVNLALIFIWICEVGYLFLMVGHSALVYNETFKMYKILNSLFVKTNKRLSISVKFKVFFINIDEYILSYFLYI